MNKEGLGRSHFIDLVSGPKDLRLLNKHQLNMLSKEIRDIIVNTVSKTGGHLASSLGAVELTIALHYVFNSPNDKIIWDVGHQAYAHKLLTGRKDRFSTLRQHKGIAGFPKSKESPHDAFDTGHSSTSISAALGIAAARDLKQETNKVISIIGDGALTGGMSFEALNHAGALKKDIIVILNDNEMSISKNVGALSSYLSKLVTRPKYAETRKKIENILRKLPGIGKKASKALGIEETIRALATAPGLIFRELGFNYFGPVDGHSLEDLIKALKNIKQLKGPILLHILTRKGKGYSYAEADRTRFHGIAPFNIENGEGRAQSQVTYTKAFSSCLTKLAKENNKIIAITAAMKSGTGLEQFAETFPERFFDVGIAEQHAVTFAAGLAKNGYKPVCAIYSTFLQRAYDQIVHDVCLQNLPVIFAVDRAGLVGEDGPTHHGSFDLSYLRHIPNMTVMAPKDENELGHMLRTALDIDGPVAIRYPRGAGLGVAVENPYHPIEFGKAEVIQEGKDLAILAVGSCVDAASKAAEKLDKKKISAAVINARFVKPLDQKLILSLAKKHGNLITVEENALEGGFGSAVLELLEKHKIDAKVSRIGIPDEFIEHGSMPVLRKEIGLTEDNIINEAKSMLKNQ
ncbi:1-deoxy-D-xylulose-5-phosphate synthase [Candidatus Woesearchaeota archaeon]|nr:1-deoxy-D-xylulose-5-phosphate synthase [Candidatus Woesearchaeota archaeon]